MVTISTANERDVDRLVELESALFLEDAGRHDAFADVTWPQREGRADFERLLSDDGSLVLKADDTSNVVGMLVGYAAPRIADEALTGVGRDRPLNRRLGSARTLTSDSSSPLRDVTVRRAVRRRDAFRPRCVRRRRAP